ncbi:hypothetical protein CC1G_12189 [Coprinopsis cinerea okayama7|uniref:Survival Motor Neuron Gemin2-binding domain-containing protein n=1 Tax=Coprinopsis cinerea (strain Okayama-7 / 130 / ATCC MYA-4618 / FGSC 9003) TaxID=240176 RepID=A8N0X9_COPC7|nr:hypothetical protein CC1G_12189 [Coprinopsis cinerea okayama7\|eukprot:XP_001828528.1 hypothetical protein CC1G_12189 [Coprinopsis cinerea okayama7\
MSGRPLVSYADITEPYEAPEPPPPPNTATNSNPPPKKRKKSNQKSKNRANQQPSTTTTQSRGSNNVSGFEESRELTHEEIWDDSALIDAWNAANEEYEAFHGSGQGWKRQPVTKAPLWYNIPPSTQTQGFIPAQDTSHGQNDDEHVVADEVNGVEGDHGHGLEPPPAPTYDPTALGSLDSTPMASQDEAFSRALNAMYWSGYWTAVYHCHRKLTPQQPSSQAKPTTAEDAAEDIVEEAEQEGQDQDEEMADDQEEESPEFVTTQR